MESSYLPFVSVILHLQMGSGGYGGQVCDCSSADDALVERWTIYHQELDFDRLARFIVLEGDDQVDVTLGLCGCPVESLEI